VSDLTDDEMAFLHGAFDLARNGDTALLAEYVDAGLPVNLTNGAGDSLLILAAYHTHLETVRALLDRGADTGRVNDRGQTALAAAVFRRAEPIVTTLLDAGADPVAGPKSALDVATFFELDDMAELLRRRAAPEPSASPAPSPSDAPVAPDRQA
jgi:ankyrin repeat protein